MAAEIRGPRRPAERPAGVLTPLFHLLEERGAELADTLGGSTDAIVTAISHLLSWVRTRSSIGVRTSRNTGGQPEYAGYTAGSNSAMTPETWALNGSKGMPAGQDRLMQPEVGPANEIVDILSFSKDLLCSLRR
jgi:hypothetical protein